MGLFDWGKAAEGVGNAVSGTVESINYALSGDLPPDVRAKLEETKLEMMKVQQSINQGQVEINKIEAQSTSLFKSGWRPMLGWIGVIGLTYHFIIYDVLMWYLKITSSNIMPPELLDRGLMELVLGMLGIGVLRTVEKHKGVTK